MFSFNRVDRAEKDRSGNFRIWVVLVDSADGEEASFNLKLDHIPVGQERTNLIANLVQQANTNKYPTLIDWRTVMGQAAHDNLINRNVTSLTLGDGRTVQL